MTLSKKRFSNKNLKGGDDTITIQFPDLNQKSYSVKTEPFYSSESLSTRYKIVESSEPYIDFFTHLIFYRLINKNKFYSPLNLSQITDEKILKHVHENITHKSVTTHRSVTTLPTHSARIRRIYRDQKTVGGANEYELQDISAFCNFLKEYEQTYKSKSLSKLRLMIM
jgi:hypothetical protein